MDLINIELFAAFLIATVILILMPGPIVTLVIANSLKHGTKFGVMTSLGANLGTATMLAAGAIGLSALVTLLSDAFDIIRFIGAAYLIYLGIREWRSSAAMLQDAQASKRQSIKRLFLHSYLTGLTNPKTMVFYLAFFPQFIDPTLAAAPQITVMTASFIAVAICLDSSYAILAGRIRPFMMDAKRALIRAKITGALLISTGVGLALLRRES